MIAAKGWDRRKACLRRVLALVSVVVVLPIFAGCVSSKSGEGAAERQARLLEGHDFNDVRISSEPADGMALTGVWRVRGA